MLQRFVDIARKHDLMLFADEIYEKIVYDGRSMTNLASMTGRDVLCLTYSGLSKAYRVCGFRAGWLAITGPLERASSFIEGIKLLANMRMCANVPAQHAIQTALGGRQSIEDLLLPQGRLTAQRDLAHSTLNSIDGISCQQADGALYLFPSSTSTSSASSTTRGSFSIYWSRRRSWSATVAHSIGSNPITSGW
ncbi:hypothetical protein GCM10020255_053870 [Rhodococcus baikonurensis]